MENNNLSFTLGKTLNTATDSHSYIHLNTDPKNSYTNIIKNRNNKKGTMHLNMTNSQSDDKLNTEQSMTNSAKRKRTFSEAKKKKSLDLPLQHKKSINSVKNSLYEALKNINKELNVKIEKKEQSKVSFSLMNFIDQDPDQLKYSDEEILENNTGSEAKEREDGFFKRMSKKVDIKSVLETFTDSMKDTQKEEEEVQAVNISSKENKTQNVSKEANNFTLSNKESEAECEDLNKSSPKEEIQVIDSNSKPCVISSDLLVEKLKEYNLQDDLIVLLNNEAIDLDKIFNLLKLKNEKISDQSKIIESQEVELKSLEDKLNKKKKLEYETKLKEMQDYITQIEKENIILKTELGNSLKYKNILMKKFNDELSGITKISQQFYDDVTYIKENVNK